MWGANAQHTHVVGTGGGGGDSATLTVSVTGSGTVYSTPGGINCGSACSGSFTPGTTVMLTATPADGYVFSGWGGACIGVTNNYCNVTMDANKSVTVEFKSQTPYTENPPPRSDIEMCGTPSGSPKAVVITHGTNANATEWVAEMALAVCKQLGASHPSNSVCIDKLTQWCSIGEWDVWSLDWSTKADGAWSITAPQQAYVNAVDIGQDLAKLLKTLPYPYQHVHFIAHSAGSNLIDFATIWLKTWAQLEGKPKPKIHQTFLDPYDPRDKSSPYGLQANWADNYVDTRPLFPEGDYTKLFLKGAYNINVTPTDDGCDDIRDIDIFCRHSRPYRFYGKSISADFLAQHDYNIHDPITIPTGIGYLLSVEEGKSLDALNRAYPKGEGCWAGDDICYPGTKPPPSFWRYLPGAIADTTVDATQGTVNFVKGIGSKLFETLQFAVSIPTASSMAAPQGARVAAATSTGTPAWLVTQVTTTGPTNTLRFNWRFTSGGEGLLRVFVNENLVSQIDQRHVPLASTEPESIYIGELPAGTYRIAFRLDGFGTNPSGVELTGIELGQQALVVDTTPPTFTNVTASPSTLWPPNHKMVNITINAKVKDDSGLPVTLNAAVTSNEPQNGLGDGDAAPDWTTPVIKQDDTGVVTITLQLRAERSGSGNGRVYTVTITATDASGNASTASVNILVPHDKGK